MAYTPKIDIPAISATMRPIVNMWQSGRVRIIDPNIGDGSFDPWTNAGSGGEPSVIWEGDARIQPLRSANKVDTGYQRSELRGVRFQIPHDSTQGTIKAGLQVYVLDGGEDSDLEEFRYVVESGINSSMKWQRTVEAMVDLSGDA